MICNEKQFGITQKQLESLTGAFKSLSLSNESDWIATAQRDALRSQIEDLEAQLAEYSLLKEGKSRYFESADLKSLPRVLIQARISKGLSQKDLAEALNMPTQQIQRYEASHYMGASLARLIEIANVLGVTVSESWQGKNAIKGDSIFVWENEAQVRWSQFPIKEMVKRGWLKLSNGLSPPEAVREYFKASAGSQYATAFHRKKFHGENAPNQYALLAWQARVLEKARSIVEDGGVAEFEFNDTWITELVSLSVSMQAPIEAKRMLASKGIILVIEPHLPGTYLDGAAMLSDSGHPVVGLTLRHDRLDNFWFVLLHELGHVYSHLFDSLNMDFFDENDGAENDELEKEADQFALNKLIDPEAWELCLSRFLITRDSVCADAKKLNIHPSIIAGRIRKEKNNYSILQDLLGQGSVRAFFSEVI